MKIIFQIDGGRGKCIAATAVCKTIKAQYPGSELIVISGYPYIFLCNDYIDQNLGIRALQLMPPICHIIRLHPFGTS